MIRLSKSKKKLFKERKSTAMMARCSLIVLLWAFVSSDNGLDDLSEWFTESSNPIVQYIDTCAAHINQANQLLCESNKENACIWFEDTTHPVSVLANAQCIDKEWAACKMADINDICADGRRGNRTPRPTKAPKAPKPTKPPKSPRPTMSSVWDKSWWKTPRPTPNRTPRPTKPEKTPRPTKAPKTPRPTNPPRRTPKPTTAQPTNPPKHTPEPTKHKSTSTTPFGPIELTTTMIPTSSPTTTDELHESQEHTHRPTTHRPTTAKPTTSHPTTSKPTSASPTTAKPTPQPTTAEPTTAAPTVYVPKYTCTFGVNYRFEGQSCFVSGDPHTSLWNGNTHDFMGQPIADFDGITKNQYYYIHACAGSDTEELPFAMLGTHSGHKSTSVTGFDYMTFILYDNNGDEYYLFLHPQFAAYVKKAFLVSTVYENNHIGALNNIPDGVTQQIGGRFSVVYNTVADISPPRVNAVLTIDGSEDFNIYMQAQAWNWNGRYRMNHIQWDPPSKFKCHICGLCGDFKRPKTGAVVEQMETCDGELVDYRDGWGDKAPEAYDPDAWTWERGYVRDNCGGNYDITANNGPDFVYNNPCDDDDFEALVKAECHKQRLSKHIDYCCNDVIGFSVCAKLVEDCYVDVCELAQGDESKIENGVKDIFDNVVNGVCQIPNIGDQFDDYNAPIVGGCKANVYANGADLLTVSASFDGGNTFTQLSYHSDFAFTAHSLIEDIDAETILRFEVETNDGNGHNGGFLAMINLENYVSGDIARIFTSDPLTGYSVKMGGGNLVSLPIESKTINNAKPFNGESQWIWDDVPSNIMIFEIDFSTQSNMNRLVNTGCIAPPWLPALRGLITAPFVLQDNIRWIKAFDCAESETHGGGTRTYSAPFGSVDDMLQFAKYAISIKFVPPGDDKEAIERYEVGAKICSNPVWNLNNGFELSYTTDRFSENGNTVIGYANVDNWIGSAEAKDRLKDACGPDVARSIGPGGLLYAAHCNGNGLHVYGSNCQWEYAEDHGKDMEVWLGFDADLGQYCGDAYTNYNYWDQPAVKIQGGFEKITAIKMALDEVSDKKRVIGNNLIVFGVAALIVCVLFFRYCQSGNDGQKVKKLKSYSTF